MKIKQYNRLETWRFDMKKIKYFGFVLLCFLFLFTGCQANNQNEEENQGQEEEQEKPVTEEPDINKDEIVISVQNVKTFNPILNTDYYDDQFLKLMFEPLVVFDDEERPSPNIAKQWSIGEDKKTLDIELRDDIQWHDGEPLTADDVVFTLDQIKKASADTIYKKCIENIDLYRKEGENTVKIVYNQPFSAAAYTLNFPIIPKHYYEGNIANDSVNINPVGDGPYVFQQYTDMKEITLTSNPDYFKGEPKIKKLKALIARNHEAATSAFDSSLVDLVATEVVDWDRYASDSASTLYEYTTYYYDFLGFNFTKPLFQDINVRKAIAYAINKDKIIETNYLGHAVPVDTPVHPFSWLYEEQDGYPNNLDKAKELLAASGWTDSDEDGILDQGNGTKLRISILVNNRDAVRSNVAKQIGKQLNSAGIETNVTIVDYDTYLTNVQDAAYDIILGGWKFSPIMDFTFAFHSTQIEAGQNYIRFNNPEMDTLLFSAFTAVGEEPMQLAYSNLQSFINEQLPYISLYFRTSALAARNYLHGDIEPNSHNLYQGIETWYKE